VVLVGGEGGDEGLERKVVDRARIAPAGLMNEGGRVRKRDPEAACRAVDGHVELGCDRILDARLLAR
jgi:hypothetical protein